MQNGAMKKITLTTIAKFSGVSIPFMWQVKNGRKRFSSQKARDISEKTGIPLEQLLFADGGKIYQSLCVSYGLQQSIREGHQ
jgi:transcriptional regulator with XRE-family HTH domain